MYCGLGTASEVFLIFTTQLYLFLCIILQWFSYLEKREVLQQEYSQSPILPSPHFRWVVNPKVWLSEQHTLAMRIFGQRTTQIRNARFQVLSQMKAPVRAPVAGRSRWTDHFSQHWHFFFCTSKKLVWSFCIQSGPPCLHYCYGRKLYPTKTSLVNNFLLCIL